MIEKVLKILCIIVVILFFICGCLTIYRFSVINKILNKMQEYVAIDNYYMKITSSGESDTTSEIFYKDGVGKYVASNGVYTWAQGDEAYLVDEENKTIAKVDTNSVGLISNEAIASFIPGYSKSFVERFILAGKLTTSIKIQKTNNVKYYVIKTNEETDKTVWVRCDTLIPVQTKAIINSTEYVANYEIEFDKVKDEDITKPNLEEYTVISDD